jgi:hypothetical protein
MNGFTGLSERKDFWFEQELGVGTTFQNGKKDVCKG